MSKPFTITKKEAADNTDCEIYLHVEIAIDEITKFRAEAVKNLGSTMKVDGFREGKVPEKIIIDRLGEIAVLEEAGQLALEKHYGDIILATEVKPLGSPRVLVTKVAPGEAFGVKINFSTLPETKIADYKKLAKSTFALDQKTQEETEARLEVKDSEIDEAIKNLQGEVAHRQYHDQNPHDHSHNHEGAAPGDEKMPLPEVNEEFIKQFGDLKTIEEFRAKIAEGMKQEKARKEVEKARLTLMESLIEKSDIKMPRMMIDSELNRMTSEMSAQVEQMGMKLADYLKHIGKTEDDMRKDWENDATKRAKTQIIMNHIAVEEKLEPSKEGVDKEVDTLMKMYQDADKMRATIYVEQFMTNDLVWKFLEGTK